MFCDINKYKLKICFIHVGKTGGTTVAKYLNLENGSHTKIKINPNDGIIIWLRNPIKRLVSAFYFAKYLINFDCSKIDNTLNLTNNIAPERINMKIKNKSKYMFSKRFDNLINTFKDVNEFFESLSSKNINNKKNSMELINYCNGIKGYGYVGFFKGYNYYFENGDFINKYHKQIIYTGTNENMENDLNNLANILNINIKEKIFHISEKTHMILYYQI